ncbi:MAG: TrkH family potassium uptake protein [bacterium]|nr:TrkH family potassium uptake protein [bacterium]
MNFSMILYILGWILEFEAGFMLLPCIVAAVYGEEQGIVYFMVAVISAFIGFWIVRKKPKNKVFYTREGFVVVALSWLLLSFVGALPFIFTGEIPKIEDALFEIVSGFTTTGASILTDVEALSHTSLFWRSFTHWIGGMGVLVFILAILPMTGGYNMHLMRAESPGHQVGKLVPRVRESAMILYKIYFVLTLSQIIILLIAGMPLFDSLTLSFGTAGTGGFGIRNDGIASYTYAQQTIITIFMAVFGVNFGVYFLIVQKKFKQAVKAEEVRYYLCVLITATLIIAVNIKDMFSSFGEALHHSAFQVSSIMTTTGYSTVDFDLWPSEAKTILVLLMFIGACSGSTGGGMKVSRILILAKTIKKELLSLIHPRSIKKIQIEGRVIEHEVLRSVNVFFAAFMLIVAGSVFLISFDGCDFSTNFTAVAATINNIGPGLSKVGPMTNYSHFSAFSKLVLIFDMLIGRLEVFPMLLLITPATWKKG